MYKSPINFFKMRVIYKQQGKPSSIFEIDENETVGKLKSLVQSKEGVTFDKNHIVFGGKTLDMQYDNQKLTTVGIKNGSIFYTALKIVGG